MTILLKGLYFLSLLEYNEENFQRDNMKKRAREGLAVLLAFSAVFAFASDKILLRFQLQEGKTYRMQMTLDQKVTQTILGQKQDMVQLIRMGLSFQAGKTGDDALIPVKVVYDSAYYKSDGPFGNVEYDSANPPSEVHPMAMGFAGIVGKSFSMKMTPDGQVKEVTGVDDMISQVLKKLALPNDGSRTEIEAQIKEQFGDKATLERMEHMMGIYPEKPVAVGDSWKKSTMLSRKPPMKIDTVWKLKSRKDGIAKIEVHSKIQPNRDETVKSGGLLLSISVTGEQKGTLEVDEKTGWLMNSEVKQKLSGKATVVEGVPDLPKGTTWPLSIESNVRFEGESLSGG